MIKRAELTGQRFGKWVVKEYVGNSKWLCICDCGNKGIVEAYNLKSGKSASCGCVNEAKRKDLLGQRFGKLIAVKFLKYNKEKKARWLCNCDCGNAIEVQTANLTNGSTVSCGCYKSELTSNRNATHGKTDTPEYGSWNSMIGRCLHLNNIHYNYYGGRGITVCNEWLDYNNFYKDMHNTYKNGLTIDRIDTNGNYDPSNCRWSTMKIQVENRRCTKLYTYEGETHNLTDWSKITGIKQQTLYGRINSYGWSFEKAITTL